MNYAENWNYIVLRHKELYNSTENLIQREWEDYFSEIFGYKRILGEIDSQRTINFGTRERGIPDIIIKTSGQDLFDVELKQYNLPFSQEMKNQLISYLRQLRLSVGILICQKIYVCVYDYKNDTVKKLEIPFVENNPEGIKFIELLQKGNFSVEQIEDFINSKNNFSNNVNKIKSELTSENILELVKLYFEGTYSGEEIDTALQDVSIDVRFMSNTTPQISNTHVGSIGQQDDIYSEPNFDYVIIKTTDKMVADRGNLYEATRYKWLAGERIAQYSFVLSVIATYVKQIYIVDRWYKEGDRWAFEGREANGEEFKSLIGKRIPEKYRKKGMASPVVYKKI